MDAEFLIYAIEQKQIALGDSKDPVARFEIVRLMELLSECK
jgi:hypothetical protein